MSFRDENASYDYKINSPGEQTYGTAEGSEDSLGSFLSRPIKIDEYDIAIGSNVSQTFNPWFDFFTNPRVINRITNFQNLRCKLCVKFVINGNGFYYGKLAAVYQMLHLVDTSLTNFGSIRSDFIRYSQMPKVTLDPTTNAGGTLCLPFVWYHNYLDVTRADYTQMGLINIRTINPLKHANGSTEPVNISVFAWAEDVVLTTPTSVDAENLVPQMGAEDEYTEGLVSRPASTVARIAGMLNQIPIIGPYARATEMASNAVASIAKLFGYSRPNNINDIEYYRPVPLGNFANCDLAETAQKLTVDSKQEITIDPTTMGLSNNDEMTISSIATRESYLTTFDWSISTAPEIAIFQTDVTPCLYDFESSGEYLQLPACAVAAYPFANWKGTMKFRFQVVCSAYHKGRLKIVYDPTSFESDEYNTNFTHVLDLAREHDFTIDVGWGRPEPYLNCSLPGQDGSTINVPFRSTVPISPTNDFDYHRNGQLRVYVVNSLTSPNSTVDNDVQVNVYVSACEDMQFRNPSNALDRISYFQTPDAQMGMEEGNLGDTLGSAESNKPMAQDAAMKVAAPEQSLSDPYDHVFFGESIVSFRTLLKRVNLYTLEGIFADTTGNGFLRSVRQTFPLYKGFTSTGATPVVGGKFNYVKMTLMNYLSPMYVCRRGGIRYKFARYDCVTSAPEVQIPISVTRLPETQWNGRSDVLYSYFPTNETFTRANFLEANTNSNAGTAASHTSVCPTIEVEFPYQKKKRFDASKYLYPNSISTPPELLIDNDGYAIEQFISATDSSVHGWYSYVSAAEDFTLAMYTGPPKIYFDQAVPTS